MKQEIKIISGILIVIAFGSISSCERDVTVDLPVAEQKIVVEGNIETGKHPAVMLSRSAGVFDPVDSASLISYLVLNAFVTVSDGITTDTLSLTLDTNYYIPVVYKSSNIIGQEGKTYTLTVVADGKTVSSETTIPNAVPLDSVWFKLQEGRDTLGYAWAHLTDPDSIGNCYRWFAKRLHKDKRFLPPPGSVFEDKFINGKSFDFAYNRGSEPNSTAEDDNDSRRGFFRIGDTIAVKFCAIDRAHFEFWRKADQQVNSSGNPFAAPSPIPTNIRGGLGIWGGYAVTYDTIIAR
ncbi:MAG: DUF4249 domain-containing protein [Bacteroidia bacterium]|nr:DUF4249 domain-containing protein [Bacteroidia bacterium]